ncbi:hypothetical protein ACI8AF_06255 [Blastococcus sp. SYSU D00669]
MTTAHPLAARPVVLAERYAVGPEHATLVQLRSLLEQLVDEAGRTR